MVCGYRRKNTLTLKIKEEYCKSCGFCIQSCPKKAIKKCGRFNKNGHEVIEVDNNACTKCGSCYTVCPDYVFEIADE
jgi:2-oxoglutarate ferredoxin oxidoreductase subunit delta